MLSGTVQFGDAITDDPFDDVNITVGGKASAVWAVEETGLNVLCICEVGPAFGVLMHVIGRLAHPSGGTDFAQ